MQGVTRCTDLMGGCSVGAEHGAFAPLVSGAVFQACGQVDDQGLSREVGAMGFVSTAGGHTHLRVAHGVQGRQHAG